MLTPGRAGLSAAPMPAQGAGWPRPYEGAIGNDLPPQTGTPPTMFRPGPGPGSGGQLGGYDGYEGADERAPLMSPHPHVSRLGEGQESWWRGGIQGFNDKLTVKDRHAYWDRGSSRTGDLPGIAGSNPVNPQKDGPARPDLRVVNRTVSFQIGSDATRNQDDLSRPYTWVGEQGSGWTPVYGGVPGLYQPYGTRGGVPMPIVSPVAEGEQGDGNRLVFSGPPHGLHTVTRWADGQQVGARFYVAPQMAPGRFDRPANSPQAGQSYSQTVRPQGAMGQPAGPRPGVPVRGRVGASAWRGGGR